MNRALLTWQRSEEFRYKDFTLISYIENLLSDLAQSFSAVEANYKGIIFP